MAPPFSKILPRQTPQGPGGDPHPKFGKKNEDVIFGISASRGFRKVIICRGFGGKKTGPFSMLKRIFGAFGARVHNN